jgi:multiple sugar transport system substrate-binding protein
VTPGRAGDSYVGCPATAREIRRPVVPALPLPLVNPFHSFWVCLAVSLLASCVRGERTSGTADSTVRITFQHQPLWGDPRPFERLLDEYRLENPGVELVTELIPNSSDVAHQYFLTALEGGADNFDLFVADVVWVPEFARAGWIADLSEEILPEAVRSEFLSGAAEVVILGGKTYAIPWFVDVGLLYYRKDLVPRPPTSYSELREFARQAMATRRGLHGYVWQGRQYEGLVCNVYEAIWGHGGRTVEGDRVPVDSPEAREGLAYLRSLLVDGISPPSVTSSAEEESRAMFQRGDAVFMRNWPYAWSEAQAEGSAIRGKVGYAPLPTASGEPGHGTLGGWQLAVNAKASPARRTAAIRLARHLTSIEANIVMALSYARNPPRRALYSDGRLL